MMSARTVGLAALLLLAAGGAPAAGQGGWTLDLNGGRVAYEMAESAPAENGVVLGIQYREPRSRWLFVSTGIPFGSGDSTWGAAGLGTRLAEAVGPVDLGVDVGAQGYVYRDPALSSLGRGGVVDLRPLIGLGRGPLRLEARSGWVQYGSSIGGSSFSRGVHDSDLTAELTAGGWARLSGTVRHVRAAEDDYSFGGGRLTVGTSRVSAWGSVGAWTSEALPTTQWGAGASVRLDDAGRTALRFSVRQGASDPVYWNAPRRRWSLGVSHRLGGGGGGSNAAEAAPTAGAEPVTMSRERSAGRVTIRIPAADSATAAPAVAGDFTGWEPVPMVEDGGHWTARFELEPGVYRYAFRSPDGEWYVPESVPGRRPDGMGGHVAVLVIS